MDEYTKIIEIESSAKNKAKKHKMEYK
jgi:hypothetical protein